MITIEEFKKKQSEKCRLIGLDLGSKRIGVSICDEKQLIATPYKTLHKSKNNELIEELKNIIQENDIKAIIIGYPLIWMDLLALQHSQSMMCLKI